MDRWRAAHGVRAIWRNRTNGSAVARGCLRALRDGRVLGLLLDQDLGDVPSVTAPFLGRPARVALGPAELALRAGAAVVAGFIGRDGADPDAHRIHIDPLPLDGGAPALALRMSNAIEAAIRRRPDEWVWLHDRWRGVAEDTAPAGHAQMRKSNFRSDPPNVALQP